MAEAPTLMVADQLTSWCGSALSAVRIDATGIDILALCSLPLAKIITLVVIVLALPAGALPAVHLAHILHRRGQRALHILMSWVPQSHALAPVSAQVGAHGHLLNHVVIRRGPPHGC